MKQERMMKQIQNNSEVLIHYSITLADNSAVDSTRVDNKPQKFILGDGSLTPAFEAVLLGLNKGEKSKFTLPPEATFGMSNPDNIHHLERSKFDAEIPVEIGTIVTFSQPDGEELPGIIREIVGESVMVDFNHPLAGQTLTFDVEIVEILN